MAIRSMLSRALLLSYLAHVALSTAVSPATVMGKLGKDESLCVDKWIRVPESPTKLDFVLIVDLSGSYRDDIRTIRSKAGAIFDGLLAAVPGAGNLRVAVASFVDYPKSPYGSASTMDDAYNLDLDFTTSKAAFQTALNNLLVRFGSDGPESQLEALHSIVNGHAGFGSPNYCSQAGHNCAAPSFRSDAARIAALTTDAGAHNSDVEAMYPGTGMAAAVAALQGAEVSVIGIKAGSCGSCGFLDSVAAATGGSVVSTSSSSAEIVAAILDGLKAITYTVKGVAACAGIQVTLSPASFTGVKGGETVHFVECLKYTGACTGERTCKVDFFADSLLLGTETNKLTCECGPGEFINAAGMCESCGCGSIAVADHTACQACPGANQASAADSDICITCGVGTFVSASKCGCVECPADFFCPGTGSPVPCPIGTFALPGSAECTPIECPDEPDHFDNTECDEWIVGDLDGETPKPYHGLLLRNLFDFGYYGFTFQNDRTPAVGNQVLAFAVMDYCPGSPLRIHGLAYGGRLNAAGDEPIAAEAESCTFNMVYDTTVERSGPGNPGTVRVTGGKGWIKCPSRVQVRLEGKDLAGAQLELAAKYVNEYKGVGWLRYPDMDWADHDRNSTPQDIDFVPLCRLPHTPVVV